MGDPQADVWVFDLAHGARTRLTFGGGTHLMPTWSADGQRVAYVQQTGSTVMSGTSLRARLANGGGQEEILMQPDSANPPLTLVSPQWSPDGSYLTAHGTERSDRRQTEDPPPDRRQRNRSTSFRLDLPREESFNSGFLRMGGGWPTVPPTQEPKRSTSPTSPAGRADGRFRRLEALIHRGGRTVTKSTSSDWTATFTLPA